MFTTNTTKVRTPEDDGKRRVVTTTSGNGPEGSMVYRYGNEGKDRKVVFPKTSKIPTNFSMVNKRETNKVDPKIKFNTTELDHLMNSVGYKRAIKVDPRFIYESHMPAPAIKTPQPKRAKKAAVKKRKAK
jgi:hypothetical protein